MGASLAFLIALFICGILAGYLYAYQEQRHRFWENVLAILFQNRFWQSQPFGVPWHYGAAPLTALLGSALTKSVKALMA